MQHHEQKLQRVEEGDPRQCHGIIAGSRQCHFAKLPNSNYCYIHRRSAEIRKEKVEKRFKYNLGRYNEKFKDNLESSEIKSLRSEIALVRLLLQKHLEPHLDSSNDMIYVSEVAALSDSLNLLIETSTSIELSLDTLLDKNNAYELTSKILDATAKITSEDTLNKITADIIPLLDSLEQFKAGTQNFYGGNKWEKDINEYMSKEKVIDQRQEIAVLRVLIHDILTACNTSFDLIARSAELLSLIGTMRRTIKSLSNLEKKAGLLLDEEAAGLFNSKLQEICTTHLNTTELEGLRGELMKAQI